MSDFHFDEKYQEVTELSDGTLVLFRCVKPSDKHHLVEGLDHLSTESRYRRFFTAKPQLSDQELRFLTEVDGENHFAMGALLLEDTTDLSRGMGLGVARFFRSDEKPACAEPAIVVVDEMQGKGLGRMLFRRLVAAAWERQIKHFRCEVLSTNDPARKLVSSIAPDVEIKSIGTEMIMEFDLPPCEISHIRSKEQAHHGALYHMLKFAASGDLILRNTLSSLRNMLGADNKSKPQ